MNLTTRPIELFKVRSPVTGAAEQDQGVWSSVALFNRTTSDARRSLVVVTGVFLLVFEQSHGVDEAGK